MIVGSASASRSVDVPAAETTSTGKPASRSAAADLGQGRVGAGDLAGPVLLGQPDPALVAHDPAQPETGRPASMARASATASSADADAAAMEQDVDVDEDVDRDADRAPPRATASRPAPGRRPRPRPAPGRASATRRAILSGSTTSLATKTSSIPASTIASASPTVAQVTPTAGPPSWRRASSGRPVGLDVGPDRLAGAGGAARPWRPRWPRRRRGRRPARASTGRGQVRLRRERGGVMRPPLSRPPGAGGRRRSARLDRVRLEPPRDPDELGDRGRHRLVDAGADAGQDRRPEGAGLVLGDDLDRDARSRRP